MQADIATINGWQTDYLVTLIETFEFERLGVPNFKAVVQQARLRWFHLPTKDFGLPDFASLDGPLPLDAFLAAELRRGRRIILHCAAGMGRTGTEAASLLIRQGRTAETAISEVRRTRPGTIESSAQLNFLHQYAQIHGA